MVYNFAATGIGSLPHDNPQAALALIKQALPEMPYWPQLANVSPGEDMMLMYARILYPLLSGNVEARCLQPLAPGYEREEALAEFYQNLWEGDGSAFVMTGDEASGFNLFRQSLPAGGLVKGQVTGPITMGSAVMGQNGKALIYDEDISEAIARGLGACAGQQALTLAANGASPVIFFDEPSLTGFGSAFSPLTREQALSLLQSALDEARQRCPQAVLGIHCCGNTDWSLIMDAGPDIISLDSVGYGAYLLLYVEQLKAFMQKGGAVAWGAVPTDPALATTASELWHKLQNLLEQLIAQGFAKEQLAANALLTPACGLGSLSQDDAAHILGLLMSLSQLARHYAWGEQL